ncbi:MAG TPA: hypothetical protein VJA21_27900 [Verrucomicrobiae bacterium]
MNSRRSFQVVWRRWCWAVLLGLAVPAGSLLAADTNTPAAAPGTNAVPAAPGTNAPPAAADTNAPAAAEVSLTPEQIFEGGTNTYKNWVEFGAGGFFTSGNKAQFQQQHQAPRDAFGGIESLHFQGDVAKGTTFTVDGRGIFDNHDYSLSLGLAREKLGYLRFSLDESRTWSDADGGFFPPNGAYYPYGSDALTLDRGSFSFEGGLTLDKVPKITFKYTHDYRDGDKASTAWGYSHPDGTTLVRGLSPSFFDIDEHRDAFQLDATHRIKATELGLGLRYEFGKADNALKIDQFPGEAAERKITDQQDNSYDLFSVHGYSQTWIKKNLMLSAGLSYSDLDNDFSGSRVYGADFDVNYIPAAQNGFGYYDLNGGSHMQEYVGNLNLFYKPTPFLSIVPSIRVMKEDTDADISGLETLAGNPAERFNVDSSRGVLDVRERLDLRYTAITNWVLFARGEWTEGQGDLSESGGLVPINGIGIPSINRQTDDSRWFQKYSAGARWYLSRQVTLDGGGYYKINHYDYTHNLDSTLNSGFDRYPAYLVLQDFDTYDGNVRLTLRPRPNLTLVSRYEYQLSTIHTKPDSSSGLGEVESSDMTSHIIAEDISWSPWSRLFFQVGFNYVLSKTRTPGSDVTQAILDAKNNYWALNFSSGLVLDDKTDLKLGYFYYRTDDYQDNSDIGLPLGAGGQEHAITATLARRLTERIRLTLRYGFFHYTDDAFGGNRDFDAHLVYSGLQYRF